MSKRFDFGIIAVILAVIAIGGLFFGIVYIIEKSNNSQKEIIEVAREGHQKNFESIVSVDNASRDRDHKIGGEIDNIREEVDRRAEETEKIKEELEEQKRLQKKLSAQEAENRRLRSHQPQTHTARKDVQPSPKRDKRAQFRENIEDAIFDVAERKIQGLRE
jgi:hypothetical protein